MKFDIRTVENTVVGRNLWAYICNSGNFNVLRVERYYRFGMYIAETKCNGKIRVLYKSGVTKHELPIDTTLELNDGEFMLCSGGCCVTSSFSDEDKHDMACYSNAPRLKAGSVVGIADFTYEPVGPVDCVIYKDDAISKSELKLYKVGKVDPHCMVVAKLIPLDAEEMADIKANAKRWLTE
jgi:hypothetical protein